MLVRFEDPHVPILKISQKRAQVLARNFSSPDGFGMIDIRIIIDVLLVDMCLDEYRTSTRCSPGSDVRRRSDRSARGRKITHVLGKFCG